jgi:hypothetical protein
VNGIDKAKTAYQKALASLKALSPDIARAFPDPDKLSLALAEDHPNGQEIDSHLNHRTTTRGRTNSTKKRMRGMGRIYKPRWRDGRQDKSKNLQTGGLLIIIEAG